MFCFHPRYAAISMFVLALFPGMSVVAAAQAVDASRETSVSIDIPAQPLTSALDRYGDLTGREVFYDAALAAGRRSGGVRGSFTPETALRLLLEGTGLSARFLADDSFALLPVPRSNQPVAAQAALPAVQQRYYALMQSSLRDAFCRRGNARPGRYRVVATFWIDPYGDIRRYQRLGSAGSSDIDRGIDDTLRSIKFSEGPPQGFEQPVLMMIVPQAPGVILACDSGQRSSRAEP